MAGVVRAAGFVQVEAHEEFFPTRLKSVDAFIELASTAPRAHGELSAFDDTTRAEWLTSTRRLLEPFSDSAGFQWDYSVVAVVAHKAVSAS